MTKEIKIIFETSEIFVKQVNHLLKEGWVPWKETFRQWSSMGEEDCVMVMEKNID